MQVLDYDKSYMTWGVSSDPDDTRKPGHMPWGNEARIMIEARCEMFQEASGRQEAFYLIAACRTEWMYRDEIIFQDPNREYRGIWSQDRYLGTGYGLVAEGAGLRKTASDGPVGTITGSDDYVARQSGLNEKTCNYVRLTLRNHAAARPLEDDDAIVRATMDDEGLIAQTELWDEATGIRAVLEYPIRTMNFHSERRRFQVDTGPVIVPDFTCKSEHWIEWFDVAHVGYNRLDRAEFIILRPTPVVIDGSEVCRVHHFSQVRQCPTRHTLFAV
jgi:hypothetical protein